MQPYFCILQAWMDKYFARILSLSSSEELPPRIRFMLLDVTDLRKGNVSNMNILDVCRICTLFLFSMSCLFPFLVNSKNMVDAAVPMHTTFVANLHMHV